MVEPPLTIIREVRVLWKRPKVDFAELAVKRWVENWSISKLGEYFDRSPITIGQFLRKLRTGGLVELDLPQGTFSQVEKMATIEHEKIMQMLNSSS